MVDKGRGEKMEIHMNVSFPRIPCELLTLDVMDVSGEIQTGVMHGVNKVRLRPESEGGGAIESKALQLSEDDAAQHLDPNYCGECYGAPSPSNAIKAGCCNTCAEVREAYAGVSWSFGRGEGVEQCEREHYSEHLDAQRKEGCRIEGGIPRQQGGWKFPLCSRQEFQQRQHARTRPGELLRRRRRHRAHLHAQGAPPALRAPAVGREQKTEEKAYNYMYFVKVVSTAYLPLGWEQKTSVFDIPSELIKLGDYGKGEANSIETHQYSVTSHKRSLTGGDASKEGHSERLHARGGIPGVFFSYVCHHHFPTNVNPILTFPLTGHLPHEGRQPRGALKVLLRLPRRRLRHRRRHPDGRRGGRQGAVRGRFEAKEDPLELGLHSRLLIDYDCFRTSHLPSLHTPALSPANLKGLFLGKMNGTRTFLDVTDDIQERLAAAFFNINPGSRAAIMATVNWNQAVTDFQARGPIAAFVRSVRSILNLPWNALTGWQKSRLAAALWNNRDRRAVMANVNWQAAMNLFHPRNNSRTAAYLFGRRTMRLLE
ncbi:hypothetical protein L1887_63275 [Cichorium endivia]|nr:hypothetical protein L1887_63275 [Cichorium endivia]